MKRSSGWTACWHTTTAAAVIIGLACAPSEGRRDDPPAPAASGVEAQSTIERIEHVAPPRDSTGKAPRRFEWTPVKGADRYAIGIWNDVDQMIWRTDEVTTNAVDVPEHVRFDFGTYFWVVQGIRQDKGIADSGRAAFVVLE